MEVWEAHRRHLVCNRTQNTASSSLSLACNLLILSVVSSFLVSGKNEEKEIIINIIKSHMIMHKLMWLREDSKEAEHLLKITNNSVEYFHRKK